MRVVQINSVSGFGSTGRIVVQISDMLNSHNVDNHIYYGRKASSNDNSTKLGNDFTVNTNILKTRLFGKHGFYSKTGTYELIEKLEEYNPDIIHLHNIHGYYLNVETLFNYLAKSNIKIIWTLHDCWSFTGQCTHFDYINCNKWKTECFECPQLKKYPKSLFFDRSTEAFNDKKRLFNSVENMTIVTPSIWLKNKVDQSFLKDYKSVVINNGINLNDFKPTDGNFRERHNLLDKFIILGVASDWNMYKGLDYFSQLANKVEKDEKIILVGLSDKEINKLPSNIIGITRTDQIKDLAEIFSTADVYVNTTLEDTFPTTNIEALACGTPVVTFETGGSPEIINLETGLVVAKGDLNDLYSAIKVVKRHGKEFYSTNCITRAKENYDSKETFEKYRNLYESIFDK